MMPISAILILSLATGVAEPETNSGAPPIRCEEPAFAAVMCRRGHELYKAASAFEGIARDRTIERDGCRRKLAAFGLTEKSIPSIADRLSDVQLIGIGLGALAIGIVAGVLVSKASEDDSPAPKALIAKGLRIAF